MQLIPAYLWQSEALGAEGLTDDGDRAHEGAAGAIITAGVDEAVVTVTRVLYSFGLDEYKACGQVTRWAGRPRPDRTVAWRRCAARAAEAA